MQFAPDLALLYAALAYFAGGVLKGAVGAGAPIIAVPTVALIYDVPTAVALFTVPALLTNTWQAWAFRAHRPATGLAERFALGGAVGTIAGTLLLVSLAGDALLAGLSFIVFLYIGLRLAHPDWVLPAETGLRLARPAGFAGGILQGAGGVSAPISITFLNAMRPAREAFIATIAVYFLALAIVQIPMLWAFDVMTAERFALSLAASAVMAGGIPVGAFAARFASKEVFDRVVLLLLAIIALRLLWSALT
ncbi:MAG: sulfite exporter TauE/SafE family protein [Pseudomonadota bacterium]